VIVSALAIFIMAFVGFSRIYTSGHYLTDILSGYALGLAWSAMIYTLLELYFQKRRSLNVKKKIKTLRVKLIVNPVLASPRMPPIS